MDIEGPDWDTLERLRNEFLSAKGSTGLYWESDFDLAQYHHYFAARIGWKWDAAIEQALQAGWRQESSRILDWGCGSGIASLRILDVIGAQNVEEVILWDHSTIATNFARTNLQDKHPNLNVSVATELSQLNLVDTLCLASHVLNELSWDDREAIAALFADSKQIFWVEPGSYDSSRLLMEQRERLIDRFFPLAPCVCAQPCPMNLDENASHWCHFFAKPPIAAFTDGDWARFSKRMEIDLRSLPYSFIAMNSINASKPPLLAGKSRVLGRPRQRKGYTRILSCDETGLNDYELWKRDDKTLWKTIKKNKGGTLFEWRDVDNGKIRAGVSMKDDTA